MVDAVYLVFLYIVYEHSIYKKYSSIIYKILTVRYYVCFQLVEKYVTDELFRYLIIDI